MAEKADEQLFFVDKETENEAPGTSMIKFMIISIFVSLIIMEVLV